MTAPHTQIRIKHKRTLMTVAAAFALSLSLLLAPGYQDAASAAPAATTLWSDSVVPNIPADTDTKPVELGTQFTSSESGVVSAIRFYKSPENTGQHTGKIWDSNGKQLTSVTFSSETKSEWQTAELTTPVQISAGQNLVVSYTAPNGRYAGDQDAFSSGK